MSRMLKCMCVLFFFFYLSSFLLSLYLIFGGGGATTLKTIKLHKCPSEPLGFWTLVIVQNSTY
jgi:hypothetical protein